MDEPKKPTVFQLIKDASQVALSRYMVKARSEIAMEEDDAVYRKSLYKDTTYSIGANGYQEKSNRLNYGYLQQMAQKNTIVASIIQTRQNQVAAFAVPAKDKHDVGFRIVLKNEEEAIDKLLAEMYPSEYKSEGKSKDENATDRSDRKRTVAVDHSDEIAEASSQSPDTPEEAKEEADLNEDGKLTEKEMRREAKKELNRRIKEKVKSIQEMVLSCGSLEERPFESTKWDFDSLLRALVRDSLTYDQIAVELIPTNDDKPHHWVPVDGGTIRYSSPALKKYKDLDMHQSGYDLLFPEKELKAMGEQRDILELDEEKLDNEDYKYVQVVRGRILRAFTPDELFIGMRNPTTNLYANGYSVAELELLLNMVSGHIFTENYNRQYFLQGFSAKGILHIKAPLNRRKLESIRVQWQHMIKGNKNSFQTPIMSGMDEIKWIPLTQNHSDMEFSNWMNYLIKIICSIFQVDPTEIGFGMREEGGRGTGGLGGDQFTEKLTASKNKGLLPLIRFLEKFLNRHIIDKVDPDYKIEFVGISEEGQKATLERQATEVKYKKSVNEVRAEDDLPPIEGADDLILDPNYMQWFTQFHPDGKKKLAEDQANLQMQGMEGSMEQQGEAEQQELQDQIGGEEEAMSAQEQGDEESMNEQVSNVEEELAPVKPGEQKKPLKKSKRIAIEYYRVSND